MSHATTSKQVSQSFAEFAPLAYWIARRWAGRFLERSARRDPDACLEELAQDAVCRAYNRFARRCAKQDCPPDQRRAWIGQSVMRAIRDALRARSRFGSVTCPSAVRDDVTNRCLRVELGYHGCANDGQHATMEDVQDQPAAQDVQRWELERVAQRELPAELRPTAIYAACGLTQAESAALQGVTDRTVRNRLREIRQYLDPSVNPYAVVCAALRECLADKQA